MVEAAEQLEADPLEMSDEDFEKMGDALEAHLAQAALEEDEEEYTGQNTAAVEDVESASADSIDATAADHMEEQENELSLEAQAEGEESIEEGSETEEVGEPPDESPTDDISDGSESLSADTADDEPSSEPESEQAADSAEFDYEAEWKKLTSPFKANGREMQIDNVDDAIRLMQMGANYNRKMAALKPSLKVLKMLEKHELLDEQKLSFLIDLNKKDPAAINKLIKDSNIDPMDLPEDPTEYKASNYAVSDKEVELDTVIDEIRGTDTYSQTLDVVTGKWDAKSKQIVADTPQLLKVINDHMANGIYTRISTEVEKERMFGNLLSVSDIEAYRIVGDRLNSEGAFNEMASSQKQPSAPKPKPTIAKPSTEARVDKRRAASPTKRTSAPAQTVDFNPLSLSDAEFEKQFDERLL